MPGLMQPDGWRLSGVRMRIDLSFYELYDIINLKFGSKFGLKFRFCYII